jgi:DNA-binding beta-propeller fold protein YncE
MGGHGTWSIGSTYPGSFAAIGPSAGWLSFWSYTGAYEPKKADDPLEQMLRRADDSSDTAKFRSNLVQPSVYILHGDKDDNVPVTEAQNMYSYLRNITDRVQYHEEPGAGHWWDNNPAPGADCVDWAPMFQVFKTASLPSNPLDVDFATSNPAVSATCRFVTIEQQEMSLAPSRVKFGAPTRVAFAPGTEWLYVADASTNSVVALNIPPAVLPRSTARANAPPGPRGAARKVG